MKSRYTRSTAQQREIMKKFLPVKIKGRYKLRDITDAVLWMLRTGCQWRNLPECFPKWESVYYHFRKWGRDGTLTRLNAGLNMMERQRQGKEATPSMLSIDSQSVKAGPMTSESKSIDGNKKINGRKRHAKGFVPVKWRWVTERTFGIFNFFRRLDKDYEKTTESQEYWVLWQNCQIILNRIE